MRSPLDASAELETIFELDAVPIFCNVLFDDAPPARAAARGTLRLGVCPNTGFVFNQAFDASLLAYSPAYENSQVFSKHFAAYQEALARELATSLLAQDLVVEVGCGQADFLRELTLHGPFDAIGFDRSLATTSRAVTEGGGTLELRNDFLDVTQTRLAPKLVVNRHVLEHVVDPIGFLRDFHTLLSKHADGRLYVEVPNAMHSFEGGIWDLIYEHCGYFTMASLHAALERAGFAVDVTRTAFDGQFLAAFATPRRSGRGGTSIATGDVAASIAAARGLAPRFTAILDEANATLDALLGRSDAAMRVVLQGAGSKGVMLLNLLERGAEILCAVDKNPRKTGRYVAGTGHRIVEPRDLVELRPDVVLVANPAYCGEIERECRDLGVTARILPI